jgi:hypothetical protein
MPEAQEIKIPTQQELLEPEGQEVAQQVAPQPSDDEVQAQESGWVPKDQWKGDPDSWRPAKEFNERGELFNRIKQQSKDIQEMRQAMAFLTNQQKKQYVVGYQDAITELKGKRNEALESGDLVAAQDLNDKIDEHKEVLKQAQQQASIPQQAPQPTQTFFSWAERNPWYTKDRKMTHFADAVGLAYKEENPGASEAEMLKYVSSEIKERFAEKFPTAKVAPSPDGDGARSGSRAAVKTGYSSDENAMTSEQRDIMRTILKTTGMTKEDYFKAYRS